MQKRKEGVALYMKRADETGLDRKREKGVTDLKRERKKQRRRKKMKQVRMDKRRGRSMK